jgi:hypothetical protein
MVNNKDGTLAARYSDFACCDYGEGIKLPSKARISGGRSSQDSLMIPNRYETQIDLLPRQYDIRVVLSDGEKFGREQMPLTVDSYDGK